jgi:hypothetical protein
MTALLLLKSFLVSLDADAANAQAAAITRGHAMSGNENARVTPPGLAELFQRYLAHQVTAHEAGLGYAEVGGEITPYEAAPAQPVEPRLAWNETLLVLQQFQPSVAPRTIVVPPDWSTLVARQAPAMALSFSAGNYPQLVRNLQPLMQARRLSDLRERSPQPCDVPALLEWSRQSARKGLFPDVLLALGVLRLMRQFEPAAGAVKGQTAVPAEWQGAWDNELAALAWQRGEADRAAALWQAQSDSVPVLFNRGIAALFSDRPVEARASLSLAVAQLPERSGWHHLARLYLALAEMRST